MKVLLLAPNAGVSLSTGGGSNFVLKQAKALARAGHQVTMAGYHALPREVLERQHGVSLEGLRDRIRVLSAGGTMAYRAQRSMPGKPSPYFALFDPRVTRWIETLGDRVRPEVAWFHDDIPRAARWAREVPGRLYVHYPLAARSAAVAPPLRRTRGPGETAQDAVLRRAAGRIIEPDPARIVAHTYANSRVTAAVCRAVWSAEAEVLPTYVPPGSAPEGPRAEEVLSVAAFHRGKGLDDVVAAFHQLRRPRATLTLIGHPRDPAVLAHLRRRASAGPAAGRIRFRPGAGRAELLAAQQRAAAVVCATEFEPFGLAVLEGMAEGATPVVRRSETSGAWTDLVEEGRRFPGFDTVAQLVQLLERRLSDTAMGPDPSAIQRAAEYSEERFERAIVGATA